jgi:PAS domain S-box-containing protein
VNQELKKEITERKRSEQRLATQYTITRVLAESVSLAAAAPHLLQAVGERLAWEWGALWNVDCDAGVLRCASLWHAPHLEAAELDAISRETVGLPGPGLKGRVWQSAEPTWIADVSQAPHFRRAPIAARLGRRGAIAFPILLRGETIGIMEFFSCLVRPPNDAQCVTLSAIGSQIGRFVERKRLEDEQRTLAALVENSPDFIGIASPEGQVLFVNAAGQKMVGLDGDEHIRATRVLDYVVADARPRVEQHVLPAVMQHGHWEGETSFRHFQTGAAIPMLQHVFCIKEDGRERPIALATISRDITERKLAEEALHTAQAELAHVTRVMTLGELAASIAHEVNQPLTAVINNGNACLRWLARQTPGLGEVRGAVRDIVANGQRASDVIARIRAALKKARTQPERLEINQLIVEIIELTSHEVQRAGVQLHTELASELPAVWGDRVQLQQVLLNLVMNGLEAMSTVTERPRRLMIRATWAGPEGVLVAVQAARSDSTRRRWSASSTHSIPPSPRGWEWGCRSAARSSRHTVDGCGRSKTLAPGRLCNLSCPARGRTWMPETEATVFVVDDDPEVRLSTARLLQSADLRVETFASALELLAELALDLRWTWSHASDALW